MKDRKKLIAGIAVCILVLSTAGVLVFGISRSRKEQASDADSHLEQARTCTVKVQMPGMSGSGVIWKQKEEGIIIVTAAHVVGSSQAGDVILEDGTARSAQVRYVSPEFDLAFLDVEDGAGEGKREDKQVYSRAVSYDREVYDAMENGDSLYAAGFAGEKFQDVPGTVLDMWMYMEDFCSYMVWADMPQAKAGMSGGGVFDDSGHLVGILCGISEDGKTAVLPLAIMLSVWSLLE